MKNSQLVTAYLDYCAESRRLASMQTLEAAEETNARAKSWEEHRLWQACLDDGWTVAELNAAYVRRFGDR